MTRPPDEVATPDAPRTFAWLMLPPLHKRLAKNARAHCFEEITGGWRSLCGRHWIPIPSPRPRGIYHSPHRPADTDPYCRACERAHG